MYLSRDMPIARIIVTAVSDEGGSVVVWGRLEDAADHSESLGFVFQAKRAQADVGLAERASRLARGTRAVVDYTPVTNVWNIARGLSVS